MNIEAKQNLKIKIFGRVQGVFFRHSALQKARELDIKGFIRNESDGSVYIEAEGEGENLRKLLEWCRQGPVSAKIKKVEFKFAIKLNEFSDFKII